MSGCSAGGPGCGGGAESWITRSAEQTRELGKALAERLEMGDVVAFSGDLGTGKTCMIQGVCAGLGVEDYVNSPSFILINQYLGRRDERVFPVYHFDLYRLTGPPDLEELGVEEYFYAQGICLLEWAERAGALLPDQRWEVVLHYLGPEERRIVVRHPAPLGHLSPRSQPGRDV